jgi:SNF2 family DNA or RNA helicase
VEQKIVDLQAHKRDLAEAILGGDNRVIQSLTREDLEYLLS